jgi:cytochrome c5
MKSGSTLVIILAVTVLTGCAGSAIQANSGGIPGQKEFRSTCVSCHSLPKPAEHNDREWEDIIAGHAGMLELDMDRRAEILEYLQSQNNETTVK